MTLYLEQYLDSLQGLPSDLKNNLSQLRDLDGQCQAKLFDIDGKVKRFVKSWRNMSRESRKKKYDAIQVSIFKIVSFIHSRFKASDFITNTAQFET